MARSNKKKEIMEYIKSLRGKQIAEMFLGVDDLEFRDLTGFGKLYSSENVWGGLKREGRCIDKKVSEMFGENYESTWAIYEPAYACLRDFPLNDAGRLFILVSNNQYMSWNRSYIKEYLKVAGEEFNEINKELKLIRPENKRRIKNVLFDYINLKFAHHPR